LDKERKGFKKELKILKRIKLLDLKDNGGFPVILSAKLSVNTGEIMMTYVGRDIFLEFEIDKGLDDLLLQNCFSLSMISKMGMHLAS
jgi:serine/threonine protein kinase